MRATAEIKSAFRRLAKKLHPDANKHDPKAASRFAELNAAYEIVGDEDKRKAFDRGEIDAEGKPRFQGFEGFGAGSRAAAPAGRRPFRKLHLRARRLPARGGGGGGGGGGFEDILRDMFGGAARGGARGFGAQFEPEDFGARRGGQDLHAELTITCRKPPRAPRRACICRPARTSRSKFRPASPTARQIRLKGQGWPSRERQSRRCADHRHVAPHPLFKPRRRRPAARSADHAL